ncbi:MAG: glycosyltransferase family 1 protein [Actinomycetota bacterium]|nr:glycosyltransferase family 1 protein [Actinomycetota bacterium]
MSRPGGPLRALVVAEQLRRAVPGGIGTYTRGLVSGLAQLEPEVAPQVALVASRAPRRGVDAVAALGRPVHVIPVGRRALVAAWDAGIGKVGRGEDVVHACSTLTPRPSVPLVATVHDLAWRHLGEAYPARGRRWHEESLERAVRRAAALVVPSEPVATEVRELVASLGRSGRVEVAVVDEGSDHLPEPDRGVADDLLAAKGVVGPYVLAVGTIEPRKNLARLVSAYAIARSSFPEPWPLLLVGPEGWGDALGRSAPPPGVAFAGAVGPGTLAALYEGARCVAYVPILEGFGLPVVEAMRAGSPVVASAVPSAGGAALEVDPLDVESIAAGLVSAATDEERRELLVARGRSRAAVLTWRRCAQEHLAIWSRVAGRAA